MKKLKNKTIVILLVAVLVIGATFYFKSKIFQSGNTSIETGNTLEKTYTDLVPFTNSVHKFSFQYPPAWHINPEIERVDLLTFFLIRDDVSQEKVVNPIDNNVLPVEYQISIRVEDNPDNISAKDYELKSYIPKGRPNIAERLEDITIAGVKGFKTSGPITPPNTGQVTEVMLSPGNKKVYRFNYSSIAHDDTNGKYLEEFYQILNTLQFSL